MTAVRRLSDEEEYEPHEALKNAVDKRKCLLDNVLDRYDPPMTIYKKEEGRKKQVKGEKRKKRGRVMQPILWIGSHKHGKMQSGL